MLCLDVMSMALTYFSSRTTVARPREAARGRARPLKPREAAEAAEAAFWPLDMQSLHMILTVN